MFCTNCGNGVSDDAAFCQFCGKQFAQETQSGGETTFGETSPKNTAANVKEAYAATAQTSSGIGKALLKWGLLFGGALILMFVLSKAFGVYAGIIGLAIELYVLYRICRIIYEKSTKIECHIYEFYLAKGVNFYFSSIMLIVIGIAWCVFCGLAFGIDYLQLAIPGLAFIVLPLLFLLIRHRGEFWKFLLLQAIMLPLMLIRAILGLFFAHSKDRVTRSVNFFDSRVTQTRWRYRFPDTIVQGDWHLTLFRGRTAGGFYVDPHGTVCHVAHKHTVGALNVQYDITPLYSRNDPPPKWIAWLY